MILEPGSDLGARLDAAVDEAFEREQVPWLAKLVECPSHTNAREDVERAAEFLDEKATELGLRRHLHPDPKGRYASHRVYQPDTLDEAQRGLLLVGHVDTVFPRSLGFVNFQRDEAGSDSGGDHIRGPGVLDMKSGLSCVFFALQALGRAAPELRSKLAFRIFCNSDEEVGSPSSHDLLAALAPRVTEALVFEAGRDHDHVITRRKGGATFDLIVRGRAAHSGLAHHKGVNAIWALSLIVPQLEALTDYARGVTVNVGLIEGGSAKNTVPEEASIRFEARFERQQDGQDVLQAIEGIVQDPWAGCSEVPEKLKQVELSLSGGIGRPPMEACAESQQLRLDYERAASAVGLGVGEAPLQGGGSDANLLAAFGVPSIDGLGPYGKNFHRTDEWSSLDSLRRRTKALARFLAMRSVGAS